MCLGVCTGVLEANNWPIECRLCSIRWYCLDAIFGTDCTIRWAPYSPVQQRRRISPSILNRRCRGNRFCRQVASCPYHPRLYTPYQPHGGASLRLLASLVRLAPAHPPSGGAKPIRVSSYPHQCRLPYRRTVPMSSILLRANVFFLFS